MRQLSSASTEKGKGGHLVDEGTSTQDAPNTCKLCKTENLLVFPPHTFSFCYVWPLLPPLFIPITCVCLLVIFCIFPFFYFTDDNKCNLNVNVNLLMLFCLFFSTVLVPLTRPLWIKSEKMCHKNWKFGKTNTSPLIKHRLLTLKSLSLSPTLFKVLLQNPKPLHPTSRGFSIQHNLNRNVRRPPPLCAGGFNEIEWTDSKRKEEEEEDEKLSHTHHDMSERKHNMATWQMTNYAFVVSLFYDFSFFFILLSPQWNSMHWLGDPKQTNRTSSDKWWSASWKDCHPHCTPPYLHIFPRASPPGAWSHLIPTTTTTPPAAQSCTGSGLTTDACLHAATLTPLHSFSPEPLFIFDWPIMVTPSDGVTYMH